MCSHEINANFAPTFFSTDQPPNYRCYCMLYLQCIRLIIYLTYMTDIPIWPPNIKHTIFQSIFLLEIKLSSWACLDRIERRLWSNYRESGHFLWNRLGTEDLSKTCDKHKMGTLYYHRETSSQFMSHYVQRFSIIPSAIKWIFLLLHNRKYWKNEIKKKKKKKQ